MPWTASLGQQGPNDTVIIHYSGHAMDGGNYLLVYDSKDKATAISIKMIHDMVNRIPARNKVFILDADVSSQLLELAKVEGNYTLFTAASPGQLAMEISVVINSQDVYVGQLSYLFINELLSSKPKETTYGEVADAVREKMQKLSSPTTPTFVGDRDRPVFAAEDDYLSLFNFSRRKSFTPFSKRDLMQRYAGMREQIKVPLPIVHQGFGRAFFEKASYLEAINASQTAIEQSQTPYPEALFTLGHSQFLTQRYNDALKSFQSYEASAGKQMPAALVEEAIAVIEKLTHGQTHALLVGIDDYFGSKAPALPGVTKAVQALKSLLIDRYGFDGERIKVLLNSKATRAAILDEFKRLAEQEEPAFFYFAGHGYSLPGSMPYLLNSMTYDPKERIPLDELSMLAADRPNLITIIDAEWLKR